MNYMRIGRRLHWDGPRTPPCKTVHCTRRVSEDRGEVIQGTPRRWMLPLLCACALSPAGRAWGQTKSLVDFEKPMAASACVLGGAECAASDAQTSQRKWSLRMMLQQCERGKSQWPSCGIDLSAVHAPGDWPSFNELLIDLRVECVDSVLVKIVLTSKPTTRRCSSPSFRLRAQPPL